ncbi:MAG: hypothetical protein HOP31_02285 [Ignavibacteria bacterium]|nr:hypothetical protein [Ignavibacteria bacterium]
MNKYYKNQLFLGIIFAIILIPVTLLFLNSPKCNKAVVYVPKPSFFNEPDWFKSTDGNKNSTTIYLLCLSKIKYGDDKASVDSNFALIRYAERHLSKGAVDDIKSKIFTGNKTYIDGYHTVDDHH